MSSSLSASMISLPNAAHVGDRRIFADPNAVVNAAAQVLGEVAVDVAADFAAVFAALNDGCGVECLCSRQREPGRLRTSRRL